MTARLRLALAAFASDYLACALTAFLAACAWLGLDRLLGLLR